MSWCEHLVGAYLASSNEKRPEIGTVWEADGRTTTARSYLKTITDSHKEASRYAREASSFIQLASGILPGQWTHLGKTHFRQLYLALPEPTATELIPTLELVWLFNATDMNKIFCEGKPNGLDIYFLNPENRILKKIFLSRTKMTHLDQENHIFKGSLEDIDDFAGTIYTANHFFKTALALPAETLSELIIRPEILLPHRGKISQVGIWPNQKSGYVQMGFEIQTSQNNMVIFTKGRKQAVRQLTRQLTGKNQ
ncbi:hypothetical protein SAMN02746065_1169 [Desulfocicer vacuolatum DSM 3385]|uniref:Uncharacterized protein n=1 Tax=Desulfocicer vacuolatum DSM 3385 TaxID=1121400 RepID=A0A1W2D853_9BACT|nr:hypothetical protein [Desulfocicer vacuolatum]SMC93669.1 hypothetical protein SAMN02746065_1169 [Desulfocicer vacuolatum DSM 3385]